MKFPPWDKVIIELNFQSIKISLTWLHSHLECNMNIITDKDVLIQRTILDKFFHEVFCFLKELLPDVWRVLWFIPNDIFSLLKYTFQKRGNYNLRWELKRIFCQVLVLYLENLLQRFYWSVKWIFQSCLVNKILKLPIYKLYFIAY